MRANHLLALLAAGAAYHDVTLKPSQPAFCERFKKGEYKPSKRRSPQAQRLKAEWNLQAKRAKKLRNKHLPDNEQSAEYHKANDRAISCARMYTDLLNAN